MRIEHLDLGDACIVTGRRFEDERGWFEEIWSNAKLNKAGLTLDFVQDNVSHSKHAGTLRGLHYQAAPLAQGKLVRVLKGAITDVVVDARVDSSTFGQHRKIDLCAKDCSAIWIPEGFLHGLVTRENDTLVYYKVTAPFSKAHDRVVRWDDPQLGIDWEVDNPILSKKDKAGSLFSDVRT